METATFGAGCFWGVEAAFCEIPGVKNTAVGFMGGTLQNPSYKDVCRGNTGHAEVTHLEYDPSEVSYEELLDVFWDIHDPTTVDRQGPDIGSQYRSVIFCHSDEQRRLAEASKERLQSGRQFGTRPIVTQIVPASDFYMAEDYHQQYFEKRGLGSCHVRRSSNR